jgi:hypothetical protein
LIGGNKKNWFNEALNRSSSLSVDDFVQEKDFSCLPASMRYAIYVVTGRNVSENAVEATYDFKADVYGPHNWNKTGADMRYAPSVLANYGVNAESYAPFLVDNALDKGNLVIAALYLGPNAAGRPIFHAVMFNSVVSSGGSRAYYGFDPWSSNSRTGPFTDPTIVSATVVRYK